MRLNELSDNPGASQPKKRKGRGPGSGLGKTAGRGIKGQKSRSGVAMNGFEGGQMPLYQRLPKRGFRRRKPYKLGLVNLGRIQEAIDNKTLSLKRPITEQVLKSVGLVRKNVDCVKLLAEGQLRSPVSIIVWDASASAKDAVAKAGGNLSTSVIQPNATKSRRMAQDIVERSIKRTIYKRAEDGMQFETAVFARFDELSEAEVCVDVKVIFGERASSEASRNLELIRQNMPRSLVAVFSDGVKFSEEQSSFSDFDATENQLVFHKRFTGAPVSDLSQAKVDIVLVHDNQVIRRFSDRIDIPRFDA